MYIERNWCVTLVVYQEVLQTLQGVYVLSVRFIREAEYI